MSTTPKPEFETLDAYQHAQFAELRSLLQSSPDPARWDELCRLVQSWRGAAFDDIEPYVQEHLGAWDDDVRQAPKRWKSWVFRGVDVPQLRLTRTLHYASDLYVSDARKAKAHERLITLLADPNLSHLKRLSLEGITFEPKHAEALGAFARNQHHALDALELSYCAPTPEAVPAWADALSGLRTHKLTITALSSIPTGALAMLATTNPLTETLRHLDLGYLRMPEDCVHVLATSPALSSLESLTHWSSTYFMPELPRALAASTTLPEHIRDFFRHRA